MNSSCKQSQLNTKQCREKKGGFPPLFIMTHKSPTATTHYEYSTKYKVFMAVEFFREVSIVARSKEEAEVLAEKRLRRHQSSMATKGYSIGDVEVIETKEVG
jgi:hypothetical protein